MVSKTFVCLVLLAVVAVCSCKPYEIMTVAKQQDKNQRIACSNSNSDSSRDSNESNQEPCELTNQKQQKNKKNLQIQDTSSESDELVGKKMKVFMSQEDNKNSHEIRRAPEHERMNMHGQQVRQNIQESRRGYSGANENNYEVEKNQINRKQW